VIANGIDTAVTLLAIPLITMTMKFTSIIMNYNTEAIRINLHEKEEVSTKVFLKIKNFCFIRNLVTKGMKKNVLR
jgi:hypothetical protein